MHRRLSRSSPNRKADPSFQTGSWSHPVDLELVNTSEEETGAGARLHHLRSDLTLSAEASSNVTLEDRGQSEL